MHLIRYRIPQPNSSVIPNSFQGRKLLSNGDIEYRMFELRLLGFKGKKWLGAIRLEEWGLREGMNSKESVSFKKEPDSFLLPPP